MNISFEPMNMNHKKAVMEIFNYYVKNTTKAFLDQPLPEEAYATFVDRSKGYPAYAVKDDDKVIGFCQIFPANPFPCFAKTADITCFIDHDYLGKGVGKMCLDKLVEEAKAMGIENLLADISSEDEEAISFNLANGFKKVGELEKVGKMYGRVFSMVIMQKTL